MAKQINAEKTKQTKLNIKAIRIYQSVTFEKRSETFFSLHEVTNKPSVELNYLADLQAMEVKSNKDHIVIPMTNVSCIYLWTENDDKKVEHKKKEAAKPFGVKASEIKRPT